MYKLLAPISDVIKAVMDYINGFTGNYAWSIIILTILFRIILLPLDIKQKKSMRKQKLIQPKIEALNKKYANDKEKLNRKTMELYKEEHFNPLSGCLPILLQFPVFIAFFGALRIVAETELFGLYTAMSQAGAVAETVVRQNMLSWAWIRYIWQPDSFLAPVVPLFNNVKTYASFASITDYETVMAPLIEYFKGYYNGWMILPVLAGLSSYFQMKLTQPAPAASQPQKESANPFSGKAMQLLFPALSVWICATSSAIFSLYWLTSNVASIVSYWAMDRIFKRQEDKKLLEGGPST